MDRETRAALHLWIALSRAFSSIEEHLCDQVEAHGLSLTEFAVLEVLLHKGALPIGEIGDRVLLASSSMTYVIDKLEQRGLLRRRRSEEDRRALLAELTPEGRTKIETVFPEHAALIRDLMDDLTPEEKRRTATVLKRLGRFAKKGGASADDASAKENDASPSTG